MKTTFVISLICSVLIALVACRELTSGKVVDKHYRAGYYYMTIQRSGKSSYPVSHYMPPSYMLSVKGYTKKGEMITETWYVSSGKYEYYKIGDQIKDTSNSY